MDLSTLPARIRAKVSVGDTDQCWPWIAAVGANGYGHVRWDGSTQEAHRVVYELLVGPIPDGATIDHTCHNGSGCSGRCPHRRCCNPAHLAPVSRGANVLAGNSPPAVNARKTACANGHPYTEATMKIDAGSRRCMICRRESDRQRYARRRHDSDPSA